MNEDKIEKIVEKILKISENKKPFDQHGKWKTETIHIENITFCLIDEIAEEYYYIIKEFLNDIKINSKFSEKYIVKGIQRIIALTIINKYDQNNIKNELIDLIKELEEYNEVWTVVIPIFGIDLKKDELNIGKIKIENLTQDKAQNLISKFEKVINASKSDEVTKKGLKENLRKRFISMVSKCCVICEKNAEPGRALEIALMEIRRSLDVLKFYIPSLYPIPQRTHKTNNEIRIYNVNIGIQGDVYCTNRAIPMISKSEKEFNIRYDFVGSCMPLLINDTIYIHMIERGFNELNSIMSKKDDQLNDYEKTIIRGIHWFSNHIAQVETDNQFLSLIICLETILTPRDGNPIGTAIAEATAIILGDSLEKRKYLKKKIKEYYSKRSAVSHGGKKVIKDEEMQEIIAICGDLLLWVISKINEFSCQKDLLNWIDDQKLS